MGSKAAAPATDPATNLPYCDSGAGTAAQFTPASCGTDGCNARLKAAANISAAHFAAVKTACRKPDGSAEVSRKQLTELSGMLIDAAVGCGFEGAAAKAWTDQAKSTNTAAKACAAAYRPIQRVERACPRDCDEHDEDEDEHEADWECLNADCKEAVDACYNEQTCGSLFENAQENHRCPTPEELQQSTALQTLHACDMKECGACGATSSNADDDDGGAKALPVCTDGQPERGVQCKAAAAAKRCRSALQGLSKDDIDQYRDACKDQNDEGHNDLALFIVFHIQDIANDCGNEDLVDGMVPEADAKCFAAAAELDVDDDCPRDCDMLDDDDDRRGRNRRGGKGLLAAAQQFGARGQGRVAKVEVANSSFESVVAGSSQKREVVDPKPRTLAASRSSVAAARKKLAAWGSKLNRKTALGSRSRVETSAEPTPSNLKRSSSSRGRRIATERAAAAAVPAAGSSATAAATAAAAAAAARVRRQEQQPCVWVNHVNDKPGSLTCDCVDVEDPCRAWLPGTTEGACPDEPKCDTTGDDGRGEQMPFCEDGEAEYGKACSTDPYETMCGQRLQGVTGEQVAAYTAACKDVAPFNEYAMAEGDRLMAVATQCGLEDMLADVSSAEAKACHAAAAWYTAIEASCPADCDPHGDGLKPCAAGQRAYGVACTSAANRAACRSSFEVTDQDVADLRAKCSDVFPYNLEMDWVVLDLFRKAEDCDATDMLDMITSGGSQTDKCYMSYQKISTSLACPASRMPPILSPYATNNVTNITNNVANITNATLPFRTHARCNRCERRALSFAVAARASPPFWN